MGHLYYYLLIALVVKKYSAFYESLLLSSEVPLIGSSSKLAAVSSQFPTFVILNQF
jgi:hypothetical protein